MDDLILRQSVIDLLEEWGSGSAYIEVETDGAISAIESLPSAPKDICDRKAGEWDMFELITSVYYGKQYYFKEEYGLVYSRASHKTMTFDEALNEFLQEIDI